MTNDINVVDYERGFFTRNRNQALFKTIIDDDMEIAMFLNTCHNTIELYYYTGRTDSLLEMEIDYFGASYTALDILFEKYGEQKDILFKLATFCFHSKSKSYWQKLKHSALASDVMASILGSKESK